MRTRLTQWEYNEISQGKRGKKKKNEDLGHIKVAPLSFCSSTLPISLSILTINMSSLSSVLDILFLAE